MLVRVALAVPGPDARAPARPLSAPPSSAAVVIDVLRATTTLTVALANGAARVIATASPEAAHQLKAQHPGARLGGERQGKKLPGFDFGNSPFEYTREAVEGRPLIFASTNGSLALLAAAKARRRVLAAFINLAAVVERLSGEREVWIVASGKLGAFAIEDAACAGLLCERLRARGASLDTPAARLAATLAPGDAAGTRALVTGSMHGRYLRALGPDFARDVEFCGGLDVMEQAFEV